MADFPQTGTANASGNATVTYQHNKTGIWWIIWQWTVETIPFRSGARSATRRNGRYVASTVSGGGASAQGPPAMLLEPSDVLEFTWTGLTLGDQAIATLYYEEVPAGTHGTSFGLI